MRRLCHALDIAEKAIKCLASEGFTDPDEPGNGIRPEKPISETAVLLLAASAVADHAEVGARIQHVAQLLIPHARSERALLGMCLEAALALDYAQAHICLTRLGYPNPGFDAMLRQTAMSQARAGRERIPHRALEQQWLTGMWKNSGSQPATRTVPASALSQPLDLFSGSREDIYAFTHALMYVTDFGICPGRLPRPRSVILAEAEVLLAFCLDEQDYDLAGEVLLAWPLTGKSWSPAAAFGFRVLAHVEDRAGFLPAPTTRLDRLRQLQGNDRTIYLLASAYHTAYVMGLLCAAALRPGRAPPSQIPVKDVIHGSADAILQFLNTEASRHHWQEEFNLLSAPERDALAGLLLCVAIRRSISKREFGAVAKLLEIGYTVGLADTPASSQAAEMLERLALFMDITRGASSSGAGGGAA